MENSEKANAAATNHEEKAAVRETIHEGSRTGWRRMEHSTGLTVVWYRRASLAGDG
jgi:hypothetical protein